MILFSSERIHVIEAVLVTGPMKIMGLKRRQKNLYEIYKKVKKKKISMFWDLQSICNILIIFYFNFLHYCFGNIDIHCQ